MKTIGILCVAALAAKLLGLLHELVPTASVVAVLRDPNFLEFEAGMRRIGLPKTIGFTCLLLNLGGQLIEELLELKSPA